MLQYILDFPVYSLLHLPSVIIQAWAIRIGIELYKGKPAAGDTRKRLLAALIAADALIFTCLWQLAPYRTPVDFPAAGSTLRYELANQLTDEPAVVQISADDTSSNTKYSYVITFRDATSKQPVVQAYLKSGQGATILVPPGDFSVSVEQGLRWFGPKKAFGPAGEELPSPGLMTVQPGGNSELKISVRSPQA
jgi:hypothetical protein